MCHHHLASSSILESYVLRITFPFRVRSQCPISPPLSPLPQPTVRNTSAHTCRDFHLSAWVRKLFVGCQVTGRNSQRMPHSVHIYLLYLESQAKNLLKKIQEWYIVHTLFWCKANSLHSANIRANDNAYRDYLLQGIKINLLFNYFLMKCTNYLLNGDIWL